MTFLLFFFSFSLFQSTRTLRPRTQTPRAAPSSARVPSLRVRRSAAAPRRRSPPKRRLFSCTRTGPRSPLLFPSPLVPSARRAEELEERKNGGAAGLAGAPPPPADSRVRATGGETSQPRWIRSLAGLRTSPLESDTDVALGELEFATAFVVCCHRHPWSSPRHLEHV